MTDDVLLRAIHNTFGTSGSKSPALPSSTCSRICGVARLQVSLRSSAEKWEESSTTV